MKHISYLFTLIIMVIFSPLAIDIFLPALPIIAEEMNASLLDMQWLVTSFILSMGLGQLISGPLADRHGRKPVAIVGILVYVIASYLCAIAINTEMLLLSRLLHGFGACAIVVAAFACVRDKFNAEQSGAMYSYLNSAICCIPALAPILGSWLTQEFGWRSNFYFMVGYALIAGIVISITLKETRPSHTIIPKKIISLRAYMPIIKHPVFMFNASVVMISMAIIIAYVSSSPAWLMVNLGLTQSDFVFWFSLNAVFNIVACMLAPKLIERFGARKTIGAGMLSMIIGGAALLVFSGSHTAIGFMGPIIMSSLGFALIMGACAGQALAPFGDKAGTASALLGFFQMSGAAVLVGIVQVLPLNEAEQVALLMLALLPLFILWKLPAVKQRITIPT
ncbi:multidrug effflux MFS transporter [Flocculibacter collagenilyticus]|uniref:multidrug effflux MFS transporter n=1 Tax=Flocculibacter collagenilyticus TaxID=2744479 RepID=UPI0018F579A9|nr:multidrug effflux MFS transporter [Flocculibacter collagenilyticus]